MLQAHGHSYAAQLESSTDQDKTESGASAKKKMKTGKTRPVLIGFKMALRIGKK